MTVAAPAPPTPSEARLRWSDWATFIFGVALALPLAMHAWVGAYSRYTADDFCWAGILRTQGFFDAQVHWYTEYSPRYAFTFLVNVAELIGPAIVPALPAAAIVIWLAVLTWTFAQFRMPKLRGLLLAQVVAIATLETAPDLPQSLYWQTGLLTYLLPIVLATFLLGWIRRDAQVRWAYGLSAAITFVAGGLSETYLIPQNVALTLALLAALHYRSRRAHVAAALAGGVLALVVILLAPATPGRVQGTPADLWLASSAAVTTAAYQALRLVRFFPLVVLLCVGAAAVLGDALPRIRREAFVIITAGVLITVPFCDFPSFYAQNGSPPMRSLIVPGAIMIGYLLVVGLALRDGTQAWLGVAQLRRAVALLALAIVPVAIGVSMLPDQATAASYATLFDAEDQQIRASRDAGQEDLTVAPLPPNFGEQFVGSNREDWFNVCVARYYGLRSIAAAE